MAIQDERIRGQENAFRKVALKKGLLTKRDLERAQKERERLLARGVNMAIYQALLRMGLLDIESVKLVLREIENFYFFCSRCGRENPRKDGGDQSCRYCEEQRNPSVRVPAPTVVRDRLIGQQLGAFKILELLGEGGSGKVYKAQQEPLDRLVAVKVLYPWLAVEEDRVKRFLREAKAMARIEHPNVVPIFDYGRERGACYLVMAYIPGEDLGRRLKERGKMQVPEALQVISQAFEGLGALHEAGVIHRDLKPENIMITGSGRVMVMDLGLVRDIQPSDTLTQSEQILGTPFYMSPEQCLNRDIDARADLYSLGVTFYQMITGSRPFGGENAVELIMSHLFERPVPPYELVAAIDKNTSSVVGKLMAKDKRHRYANAQAALEDVRRLQAGERPLARPRGQFLYSRGARRIMAALTMSGVLVSGWMWFGRGTTADRKPQEQPSQDSKVSAFVEGRAAERLEQARRYEATEAGNYQGGTLDVSVWKKLRTLDELRQFIGRMRHCQQRYQSVIEDYGQTKAASEVRNRINAFFALREKVLLQITRLQSQEERRRKKDMEREQRARVVFEDLRQQIYRLVSGRRYAEAREVLRQLDRQTFPFADVWLASWGSKIERREASEIHQILQEASAAELSGDAGQARRILLGWPAGTTLPRPIQQELAAIERRIEERRRTEALAWAKAQVRTAWPPWRKGVMDLVRQGNPFEAQERVDQFIEKYPDARGFLGDSLAGVERDLKELSQIWQKAKAALRSRVGKRLTVRWRASTVVVTGKIEQAHYPPFLLKVKGQPDRAFDVWDLHIELILGLAARDKPLTPLTVATARYCAGLLDCALKSLSKATEGPRRTRLFKLVTGELIVLGHRRVSQLLAEDKFIKAYKKLQELDRLDPAAMVGQGQYYKLLAQRAAGRYLLLDRQLLEIRKQDQSERLTEWRSSLESQLIRDGSTLVLQGLQKGTVDARGKQVWRAPYRVRTALRLNRQGLDGGGLLLGCGHRDKVAGRSFVALQIDIKNRYQVWRYLEDAHKKQVLSSWKTLHVRGTTQLIGLELVVLPDRLHISVSGRPLCVVQLQHDELTGALGFFASSQSHLLLCPVRVDTLKLVPRR